MSDSSTPVIELQGLEVKFGKRAILKGLNASLSGRCIGLLIEIEASTDFVAPTAVRAGQRTPAVVHRRAVAE